MFEIILYSLGGQGGVTTARLVAVAAMKEGYYSQAIPQFGPERRGAVVHSYLRISEKPIRRKCRITNPDITAIFDKKIKANPIGKIAVINTSNASKIAEKTLVLDATKIAEKYGLVSAGWPILSAPMSAAIAKVLSLPISSLEDAISEEIPSKVEENIKAAKEAYEVVKWI